MSDTSSDTSAATAVRYSLEGAGRLTVRRSRPHCRTRSRTGPGTNPPSALPCCPAWSAGSHGVSIFRTGVRRSVGPPGRNCRSPRDLFPSRASGTLGRVHVSIAIKSRQHAVAMARIVVIGAGFAGQTDALYLGRGLGRNNEVVVNASKDFYFIPFGIRGIHMPPGSRVAGSHEFIEAVFRQCGAAPHGDGGGHHRPPVRPRHHRTCGARQGLAPRAHERDGRRLHRQRGRQPVGRQRGHHPHLYRRARPRALPGRRARPLRDAHGDGLGRSLDEARDPLDLLHKLQGQPGWRFIRE